MRQRRAHAAEDRPSPRFAEHQVAGSTPGDLVLGAFLLLTMLCAFVPFDPLLPGIGLDPSWRFALNEAVARGYVFGSQIVFTYGPYASVFTGAWHPDVAGLTFGASAWLAVASAIAVRTVVPRGAVAGPLLLCALIAFVSTSRDVLLLASPLFATCATPVFARAPARGRSWAPVAAAVVYSAAGLLVLVKGSLLVPCVFSTLLNAAYLLHARRPAIAALALAAPLGAAALFWTIAGQPLAALPAYVAATLAMARGYSAAMALSGTPWTVAGYLVGAALLLVAVLSARRQRAVLRTFLAVSLLLYLFVAFKSAFVRQDAEHALIASTFLLVASAVSWTTTRALVVALATAASLGLWASAQQRHDPLSFPSVMVRVVGPYDNAIATTLHRWSDARWPRSAYERAVARIAAARPLPTLDGTVDIYSYGQSPLIASGARWWPRPVFQSYAAYDPQLAARNADFLAGPQAPRHILFAIEPIDRRLPALEDGASWPGLLDRYRALPLDGPWLRLQRREAAVPTTWWPVAPSSRHTLGETVPLGDASGQRYVAFDVRPTPAGKLRALLYRTSGLLIVVTLEDGSTRTFLLPPSMAGTPFLLSPLVEDTHDFAALFERAVPTVSAKRVRSFRLQPAPNGNDDWAVDYGVSLFGRTAPSP